MTRAALELGPYSLGERIGEGGSGQIYRALGPTGAVAIKLLGPATDLDDAARSRFAREIAALGQLSHPNLVQLLDHGVDAELGPYLVLPLLAGSTLRALPTLCPEAALLVLEPIVAAIGALHAAGYVHRDIKPENAIAAPDGTITVIDLGLAWRDGMTRHTDTGAAVGSVGYMAPEQIEGRAVDGAADIWALGVMLYEWIAGKRPFARPRAAEEAAAVMLGTCPRLDAADRRCDDKLADLVARCLAIDPATRPTAAELARAIGERIDWTEPALHATERAAVIADPAAYQARVAPFRVRRVERLARAALDAKRPFVALACCDRGLAYAPDHPALLALVAEAEAATAPPPEELAPAPIGPPQPAASRTKWPLIAALGLAVGALVTYAAIPARGTIVVDPWSTPRPPPSEAEMAHDRELEAARQRDRALASDMIGVLGNAFEKFGPQDLTSPEARARAAAAASCVDLAAMHDGGALTACEKALSLDPSSAALSATLARVRHADACAHGNKAECDPWAPTH